MLKKAVVLSSGGLDSTTVMAVAKSMNYEIYSLSFDYGQKHKIFELKASRKVADFFSAKEHKLLKIDLSTFGGSALTDSIHVPKQRSIEEMVIQMHEMKLV